MTADTNLGLVVQLMASAQDRVLVVAEVTGQASGTGLYSPSEVGASFDALRLPKPSNISDVLARLRKLGMVVRVTGGWALTPMGKQRLQQLVADLDTRSLVLAADAFVGTDLGQARHTVIDWAFAPVQLVQSVAELIKESPFDKNVFCVTRYPDTAESDLADPLRTAIDECRQTVASHGMVLRLASDRMLSDTVFDNVVAHIWSCKFGIALVENRRSTNLNDNLLIEVGSMLITGRRCALLKDKTVDEMPTDLVGHIYKSVDFSRRGQVSRAVDNWLTTDLGLV